MWKYGQLESSYRPKQQDILSIVKSIHLNKSWCKNHMSVTLTNQLLHKIRTVEVSQLP